MRSVGAVHDLGEGASRGSLTFSTTQPQSTVCAVARASSSCPPADAAGGQERSPLMPRKTWIQTEGKEEGEGCGRDAAFGSEVDGYEVA